MKHVVKHAKMHSVPQIYTVITNKNNYGDATSLNTTSPHQSYWHKRTRSKKVTSIKNLKQYNFFAQIWLSILFCQQPKLKLYAYIKHR